MRMASPPPTTSAPAILQDSDSDDDDDMRISDDDSDYEPLGGSGKKRARPKKDVGASSSAPKKRRAAGKGKPKAPEVETFEASKGKGPGFCVLPERLEKSDIPRWARGLNPLNILRQYVERWTPQDGIRELVQNLWDGASKRMIHTSCQDGTDLTSFVCVASAVKTNGYNLDDLVFIWGEDKAEKKQAQRLLSIARPNQKGGPLEPLAVITRGTHKIEYKHPDADWHATNQEEKSCSFLRLDNYGISPGINILSLGSTDKRNGGFQVGGLSIAASLYVLEPIEAGLNPDFQTRPLRLSPDLWDWMNGCGRGGAGGALW
jgi:hypothetical protein